MIFQNPSILIGLTAVLIPILVHLFNLKKVKKVEFSTLMFLKDIQKSRFRRIRIKQLILLLLRMLIIAFIVLMFSNPVIEGYSGVNSGNTRKSGIVIIDNSFSMDIKDENGNAIDKAKNIAGEIISNYNENDNISLILSSQLMQRDFKYSQLPLIKLMDTLVKTQISYKIFSFDELSNLPDKINSIDKNNPKEYFIISDFNRTNFSDEAKFSFPSDKNDRLYLINPVSRSGNNISLDSVFLVSKIIESGNNIKLSLKITNHSVFPVSNKIVKLITNDNIIQENAVDLLPFESKYINFAFKPIKTGQIKCKFELKRDEYSQDELEQDNILFFVINIPEIINTGVLGTISSADFKYIKYAVDAANKFYPDSSGKGNEIFNVSNINNAGANSNNDVLIINNQKRFSDSEKSLIKEYLESGRGVLMFAAMDLDIENYNSLFSSLNIFSIHNPAYISNDNISKLVYNKINYQHPIFEGIFKNNSEDKNPSIDPPEINMYYNILPELNSYPLIALSDNSIFMVESKALNGNIIFCSVSANSDMSKFPLTGLFPTILIRSLQYLSRNINNNLEYAIGKSNIITFTDFKNLEYFITPDNKKISLNIQFGDSLKKKKSLQRTSDFMTFPYTSKSEYPGFYTFYESNSGSKNYIIALNPDPKEADLRSYDKKDIINYFEKMGFNNIKYIDKPDNLKTELSTARKGLELWKYLLLLSVILIFTEILYSRKLENS